MTNHRSSIPEVPKLHSFTPPPPVTLDRARRSHPIAETTTPSPEKDTKEETRQEETPNTAARATPNISPRKRFAALLALVAVPAMAAPGDFGAMAGDAPGESATTDVQRLAGTALAFETPGMSFPGSAFYYLADPPTAALIALPESDPLERGAVGGYKIGAAVDAGPAASSFFAGSGANFTRAADCLAQAIWYEAASESEAGQRAVAQVVLNRVAHPSWPSSVCGVVYEGSQRRTGCQFSFTCDGSLSRRAVTSLKGKSWENAQTIAANALSGDVYAPIGHATHYHTLWVDPYWASSLDPIGTIGAHRFYRSRGNAGEKSAFSDRYTGTEPALLARAPVLAGAPVTDPKSSAVAPRVEISAAIIDQGVTDAEDASSLVSAASAPSKGERERSGQARKKYAQSGQWKVDPASLNRRNKDGNAPPSAATKPVENSEGS